MIDTLLALVPVYGVWLIMISVALSCLALPIPSSMLVMAAGGFAAAGDFSYWQLVFFALVGFIMGDQVAFWAARKGGNHVISKIQKSPKAGKVLNTAENLISRYGGLAIFISRTVFSPVGPYVAYTSGALHFDWPKFTFAAVIGAAVWCSAYSWLGYAFANNISQIADMIANSIGIVFAAVVAAGLFWWLLHSYRNQAALD